MVQLAIKITRGAGGLSISPLLTVRGFVRNDSPVFALFDHYAVPWSECNLAEYMDYASARMLQLFADGAGSPYDVNEDGQTILHVRIDLLFTQCQLTTYFASILPSLA
jgi:hypothetical protein